MCCVFISHNLIIMKDVNAVKLGKKGGIKRWLKVSKKERSRIMRELSFKRWKSKQ